jgi:hypothetical protein
VLAGCFVCPEEDHMTTRSMGETRGEHGGQLGGLPQGDPDNLKGPAVDEQRAGTQGEQPPAPGQTVQPQASRGDGADENWRDASDDAHVGGDAPLQRGDGPGNREDRTGARGAAEQHVTEGIAPDEGDGQRRGGR